MTLPVFRAKGTGQTSMDPVTPGMPAGVLIGDILLLFIETEDEAITVSGGTETWTEVTGSPVSMSVTTPTRLTVFWARASQNAPTSPTTSDSGDHQNAVILAFAGCVTTGEPWNVVSTGTESTSDQSVAVPGATTTIADCLIVIAATVHNQNFFGSWANADLGSVTERHDLSTTLGNDGTLAIATGTKAAAGSYGDTTASLTVAGRKAYMTIALAPPVVPIAIAQAVETDTAGIISLVGRRLVAQVSETDTAQVLTAFMPGTVDVSQALETDIAQVVTPVRTADISIELEQAVELDRAKQIAVAAGSGVLPVSEFPVLIRAPLKAGRTFVEIVREGETYHPNVADPQAEEEAPGGWKSFTGRISERTFRAHRDIFVAGARLHWWHEDGTLLHRGNLLEPDTSDGAVQITDRGDSALAEREVGPILYQRTAGIEVMPFGGHPKWWSVRTDLGNQSDAMIVFERQESDAESDGGAWAIIPFFGRELAHMRFRVTGASAFIEVYAGRKGSALHLNRPSDIDIDILPVWIANFNPTTGLFTANIELDLTLQEDDTSLPQENLNNYDNTQISFVYPDCVVINVGDDQSGESDTSVELTDIEINGAAVGERSRFSCADLVADIASVLGIGNPQIEGGGFDVLPYELPPGAPASEALDYAALLSDMRWRICGNGLEFGNWDEHVWGLASPWSPFDAIPQERFDAVAVPFRYAGSELDDQVVVRLENSPLDRRSVYWGLALSDPAHNREKAENLGALIAETLSRKRNAGSFAAAELIGPDGERTTAHHANAGDTLYPLRSYEEGRLRISALTRFEDHIEGTFDGENHTLDKLLARREKKMSRR